MLVSVTTGGNMRAKKCEPERLAGKANERLQEEVYRQMFRAESRVPAADLDLAMILVPHGSQCKKSQRILTCIYG